MKRLLCSILAWWMLLQPAYAVQFGAGTGTGYPSAVDTVNTRANKGGGTCSSATGSNICAEWSNDLQGAVAAIEAELGTLPKGSYADVKTRLNAGVYIGTAGATLTPAAGGLIYSTSTALAVQAAGTSGYFARSGGTGAPTWFDLLGTANTWSALQTFSAGLTVSGGPLLLGSDDTLAWGDAVGGGTADTILSRGAANILVLKNGTAAQELNIFGNATAKMRLLHDGSDSRILSATGALYFGESVVSWFISSTHLQAVTDNSSDIGTASDKRPRSGYFGTSVFSPSLIGGTGTTSTLSLQSTSGVGATGADIIFKVGNNGATEAGRILNSGAWGFGIANPARPFHIHGTVGGAFLQLTVPASGTGAGDGLQFIMDSGGANTYIENGEAGFMALRTSAQNRLVITSDGSVVLGGQTTAASLLDLRAGDLTFSGANGQKYVQGRATELVAVGSGISTKATTIQIPADAIVDVVSVRVKTQPGGTSTVVVTSTTSGDQFQKGASISTVAGTTDPGTKGTPRNYNSVAAQTVTLTFDVPTTDALGEIRVDLVYRTMTPATS